MKLLGLTILMLGVLGATGAAASAQQPSQPHAGATKARVELIVGRTAVRPGETIPVGVKFTMEDGWHIYWKNPGDAGQAPSFQWTLPGGGASRMMRGGEWSASEPEFPAPVRWEDAGGIVGYGYTGSVIFPAELKVPSSATPGQEVELRIAAQYLVCKEICLSEYAIDSVTLSVSADSGEEAEDVEAIRSLEAARQLLPVPAEGARAQLQPDGTVQVSAAVPRDAKRVEFFPNPPAGVVIEELKAKSEGGQATARFRVRRMAGARVEAAEFEGVFGYDTNQGRGGVSVKVPVPPAEGAGEG